MLFISSVRVFSIKLTSTFRLSCSRSDLLPTRTMGTSRPRERRTVRTLSGNLQSLSYLSSWWCFHTVSRFRGKTECCPPKKPARILDRSGCWVLASRESSGFQRCPESRLCGKFRLKERQQLAIRQNCQPSGGRLWVTRTLITLDQVTGGS